MLGRMVMPDSGTPIATSGGGGYVPPTPQPMPPVPPPPTPSIPTPSTPTPGQPTMPTEPGTPNAPGTPSGPSAPPPAPGDGVTAISAMRPDNAAPITVIPLAPQISIAAPASSPAQAAGFDTSTVLLLVALAAGLTFLRRRR